MQLDESMRNIPHILWNTSAEEPDKAGKKENRENKPEEKGKAMSSVLL